MEKDFRDIGVGQRFIYGGIEYIRIQDNRISCCRVANAHAVSNPNNQTYFSDDTKVTFNG